MTSEFTSFLYGANAMFFGLTAWLFWAKPGMLSKLVALLMITICVEYLKDLVFLFSGAYSSEYLWTVMTAVDMVAVPMYAFLLMELVCPGRVTPRRMVLHELPFVLLPLLLIVTRIELFYYILVGYACVYGTAYLIWTAVNIPRYHRLLKERFSYTENINLNWLRLILFTFYFILAIWILDCLVMHMGVDVFYMLVSLLMWMIIDFYIYKHESVIDELNDSDSPVPVSRDDVSLEPELCRRISSYIVDNKAYLDSHLKLSDIAKAVGSNRTYVSNFFNRGMGSSFYDYINGLRVEYACELLQTTELSTREIAAMSGFNSVHAFVRVFRKAKGATPADFRTRK